MAKVHRVLLDQSAYDAIRAESLIRHKTIKDTLNDLVFENLSHEAQHVLGILHSMSESKTIMAIKPNDDEIERDHGTVSDVETNI